MGRTAIAIAIVVAVAVAAVVGDDNAVVVVAAMKVDHHVPSILERTIFEVQGRDDDRIRPSAHAIEIEDVDLD